MFCQRADWAVGESHHFFEKICFVNLRSSVQVTGQPNILFRWDPLDIIWTNRYSISYRQSGWRKWGGVQNMLLVWSHSRSWLLTFTAEKKMSWRFYPKLKDNSTCQLLFNITSSWSYFMFMYISRGILFRQRKLY